MDEILQSKQLSSLGNLVDKELSNRNRFALTDFNISVNDAGNKTAEDELNRNCLELYKFVFEIISNKDKFLKLINWNEKPKWVKSALFMGKTDEGYNLENVALYLCVGLIQEKQKKLDDYIKELSNSVLHEELGIKADDELLVNLEDKRLELKHHGIIFNKSVLIYPHQFLRRYYSANFVGMPALLNRIHKAGVSVSIRLDPLRKTNSKYYRDVCEFDYWSGPKFSDKLLKDTHLDTKTVHGSRGFFNLIYDVKFTIFRTKMMDRRIREFMVEEYCPLRSPFGEKSSGFGEEYCIQKFAHLCYDQSKDCFTHLDGAVRVFTIEEYEKYFKMIENGQDIDDKVGIRHKMFLVEGQFGKDLTQELITEWFRYNPHIQEYFSGLTIEPAITYEKWNEIKTRVV